MGGEMKKEGEEPMNGACLFLGILFLAAGIYFYSGKAVNHITAWKTMPEEEKENPHSSPLPKCGDDDRHKRYHFFTQRSMVRVS